VTGGPSTYYYAPDIYIPDTIGDIDCTYRDPTTGERRGYCKICGGLGMVLAKCDQHKDCIAFHMEPPTNGSKTACGYLKSARAPLAPLTGHSMYFRDQPGAASFKVVPDTDTPKNEISCNYKDSVGLRDFCKVCGGVTAVIKQCNIYAERCVAINMENDDCGYLKSAALFTQRAEFVSYEKL
jgi:hypothetical protein